jgi:hypothetical protein
VVATQNQRMQETARRPGWCCQCSCLAAPDPCRYVALIHQRRFLGGGIVKTLMATMKTPITAATSHAMAFSLIYEISSVAAAT